MEGREGGGQLPVNASDGIDRKSDKVHHCGGNDDRNQRAGNFIGHLWPEQHNRNGCKADNGGGPVDGANVVIPEMISRMACSFV